ncbi:acyl-CoA dehydrogenase [Agromyces sp. ISL-38]|uniref:acyl-CoA dehydrogenase n=1 Tax=Agromyces sp. ISL-38 TaxID=2819107 RepID=UPI001BE5D143|nr:acyl-CoA dehydrogenase [Agromyces sp. ISL-38]MBT2498935.1 acyl-CoA dehydrogenase [Agromyces sp. ISL-38]
MTTVGSSSPRARTTAGEPDDLDALFGDPMAPGPFGYATIADDDQARRMSAAAESILEEWGAGADFVPASLGGRWVSTEDLVQRWRPIFRRDPSLGLGYGITTLMAALNVWVAGDDEQRADVADRLVRGERIAVGFHELDHGNDLLHNECAATERGGRWYVRGQKHVINNVDRAESILIMARTSDEPGARSHTLLMWNKDDVTRPFADTSRRVLTAGMRGCRLGDAVFDDLPVPASGTIGAPGAAAQVALTAFQVSRAVVPALAIATVDAALDLAVRFGSERSLYGGVVLDLPHARALLAGAIADFLIADALSAVVVRALHLAPAECLILTAAAKYLVPHLLTSAMQDLSVLFGSTFYARVAPYEIFEKFLRDLAIVPIGHGGSTACLLTILPNLPAWLRRSRRTQATDPALFQLGGPLEELDFGRLSLGAGSSDPLGAALRDPTVRERFAPDSGAANALDRLGEALDELGEQIDALTASELGTDAPPAAFALAHRLTLLLAAGAWGGVCAGPDAPSITRDPLVREACLARIEGRLSGRIPPLDPAFVDRLIAFAEDHVARDIRLAPSTRTHPRHPEAEEGSTA